MASDEEAEYFVMDSCSLGFGDKQTSSPFVSARYSRKFKEIVPDRFDGTSSWVDYWTHFQACWNLNQWSDDEAALVLACCLSKSACKVLNPKPKDNRGRERNITIYELKSRLELRYGPGVLPETFLAELKTRKQGSQESIQELGESVGELVRQAYPDVPDDFLDRMGVIHFRDAIVEAEIRAALFRNRPTSLDEAIKIAVEVKCFMDIEAQRKVHTIEKIDKAEEINERLDRLERHQDELINWLTNITASQESKSRLERSQRVSHQHEQCFNCGDNGHQQSECPFLHNLGDKKSTQMSYEDNGHQNITPGIDGKPKASEDLHSVTHNQTRVSRISVGSESNIFKLLPSWTLQNLREAQLRDCTIAPILKAKEASTQRPDWHIDNEHPATRSYWNRWDQLEIVNGVLCKRWKSNDHTVTKLLAIVPQDLRKDVFLDLHGCKRSRHLGVNKTWRKLKERFTWYGMSADIKTWIRQCEKCFVQGSPANKIVDTDNPQSPEEESRTDVPVSVIPGVLKADAKLATGTAALQQTKNNDEPGNDISNSETFMENLHESEQSRIDKPIYDPYQGASKSSEHHSLIWWPVVFVQYNTAMKAFKLEFTGYQILMFVNGQWLWLPICYFISGDQRLHIALHVAGV